MKKPLKEYSGSWEDLLSRADELAGKTVYVRVLSRATEGSPKNGSLAERNLRMLSLLDGWQRQRLSDEEKSTLDEMEMFLRENPLTLNPMSDE